MQNKRSMYAWAMYDWANSAYATTVMAGFFPLFFKSYYSAEANITTSTAQLGFANSLSSFIVVLLAPLLGAIADGASLKKRFLFLFAYLGILMSASLALVGEGEWQIAILVYVLANIGFMSSNTFYDGLLHSVSNKENIDYVSGLGFALGYLGGGVLFAINVWMVQDPHFFGLTDQAEAIKLSFVSVALWWALFSLPIFFFVEEKRIHIQSSKETFLAGYARLKNTLMHIKTMRPILLFLLAYWLYIDGVDTIIRMAVDYGMALGFDGSDLVFALLLVQFVGFPATLIFTKIAQLWDTKKMLFVAILSYLGIVTFASLIQEVYHFYILALCIALVQGGIQALSRSYYARMIPQTHEAEFFGFYNFLGKFAAIIGPALVAVVALFSESSRVSIASIAVLFVLGGVLLYFVKPEEGRS